MGKDNRTMKHYDAIIIGAGPYGLSTAACMLGRGLNVAIFGKPMEFWRERMPQRMRLRSHWWATNLIDHKRAFTFGRFFRERAHTKFYPEPISIFIDYAEWFRSHAVPDVDPTYVSRVEKTDGNFIITLADGRQVEASNVVMA